MNIGDIRTLDKTFASAGIAAPVYVASYNDQWKHFRADVPDGLYQVAGGDWTYEIVGGQFVRAISGPALSQPDAPWSGVVVVVVDAG